MKTASQVNYWFKLLAIAGALAICQHVWSQPVDDANDAELEAAKAALQEAKSALESAQNTLNQAHKKPQDPPPANNTFVDATTAKKATESANSQSDDAANRLYKWVDEDGKVSYQNSPPPKNAKVLDSDVLKSNNPNNTSDEPIKELRVASTPETINDGSTPVMVYTADNCKPCQSVVLFLTQKQVPFIERDIRSDRKARSKLAELSKQITVPSLFIGDRIIQGNVKPVITRALEEAGYLEPQR